MKINKEPEKSNDKKYLFIGLVAFIGFCVISFFIKHLIDLLRLVDLLK